MSNRFVLRTKYIYDNYMYLKNTELVNVNDRLNKVMHYLFEDISILILFIISSFKICFAETMHVELFSIFTFFNGRKGTHR